MYRNNRQQMPTSQHRVNQDIRSYRVRVVKDGQQLGVMSTSSARQLAGESDMDLVEMVPYPAADPPVCHIIDYSKWKYEQSIKKKQLAKSSKIAQDKEIQLNLGICANDLVTKINKIKEFIGHGWKVLLVIKYRGREKAHKDLGFTLINSVISKIEDVAVVENSPKLEGDRLMCKVAPLKKKVGNQNEVA